MSEAIPARELFSDIPKQDSPRLAWVKRHGIQTYKSPYVPDDEEPWSCWVGTLEDAIKKDAISNGPTEADAIAQWAKDNDVRLWNEEQSPPSPSHDAPKVEGKE